jgi:hypothetical protein
VNNNLFFRFRVNSLFYIITLFTLTLSAIVASTLPDPAVNDLSPLQLARAVCEIWSLGMAVLTLLSELNQLRKYVLSLYSSEHKYELSKMLAILAIMKENDTLWLVEDPCMN